MLISIGRFGFMVGAILLCSNLILAEGTKADKKWQFQAEPYILFPSMAGTTGIRNLPDVQVDANPGDIFSQLTMGFMMYAEARSGNWAITTDLLYSDLAKDVKPGNIVVSGKVSAKQIVWELSGLYRIAPFLEAGIGGRLNNIETGVDIVRNNIGTGTSDLSGRIANTWVDPVIIAGLSTDLHKKWLFRFRGDIGGFTLGSNLTWQLQGFVACSFSKLFQLKAGYKIYSLNYDKGSGADRFRYDVNLYGPAIGAVFNF
jgi:hypothetical protein